MSLPKRCAEFAEMFKGNVYQSFSSGSQHKREFNDAVYGSSPECCFPNSYGFVPSHADENNQRNCLHVPSGSGSADEWKNFTRRAQWISINIFPSQVSLIFGMDHVHGANYEEDWKVVFGLIELGC